MTADRKPPATEGNAPEMERIRDIILGPQMRVFEGQFDTLASDLERLRAEIAQLQARLAEQDNTHTHKTQALDREFRKALESLREELRQTSRLLTSEKVDRAILGDLLIEMGGLLKTGGSFADAFKGLLKTGKEK